ncbi:MAG: hypothetical protein NC083_09025 [Muribaculum sp.]|nr:hypothetical protein [Muribaculum sp.]MCM1577088.1 hypothetical protein [Bacteroides sp.]
MITKARKTAILVVKTDVRATLLSFSVDDEMIIKEGNARYASIKNMAARLEKETSRRYYVTIKDIPEGTYVKRLA